MTTLDLSNHWTEKAEWSPGRRLWAFYLTFDGQAALHARIRRDQEALRNVAGLDLIPVSRLHMSIQGVAFVDQVEMAQVEEMCAAVQDVIRAEDLPTLWANRAQIDFDAVSLPVFPVLQIRGIKESVKDIAARVFGRDRLYQLPEPPGGFAPHISIAYANSYVSPEEISAAMAGVEQGTTPIDVGSLSLVALRREQPSWFWDHERRLSFSTAGVPAPRAMSRSSR